MESPGHSLQVGDTEIPYAVRYSPRAARKRIVVTPAGVEVVAPVGTPLEGGSGVYAFVDRKRRWLFDARREIDEQHQKLLTQRYASGAKLQYRGRWLMLDVQAGDVDASGVGAKGYRLSEAKGRWGSLGQDGVVRIHWRLIQAPAAAMEYVVAHEVAHLCHRNHSPEFWQTLGRCLPDWAERKMMLERWETDHRAV